MTHDFRTGHFARTACMAGIGSTVVTDHQDRNNRQDSSEFDEE
jgi:hypothetical protein